MTLDEFKVIAPTLKKEMSQHEDIIDYEHGTAIIFSENLNKYLEKYMCKNADDLENTLYYNYGIYCKIY